MLRRRYPSDLTDAQWAQLEPVVPLPRLGGRPPRHARRELIDAMLYVLRNGVALAGGPCRTSTPPGKRSTTTSGAGATMAPSPP